MTDKPNDVATDRLTNRVKRLKTRCSLLLRRIKELEQPRSVDHDKIEKDETVKSLRASLRHLYLCNDGPEHCVWCSRISHWVLREYRPDAGIEIPDDENEGR